MACVRASGDINSTYFEYCVDTVEEIELLPTQNKDATGDLKGKIEYSTRPNQGSITLVINDGSLLWYILNGNGEWIQIQE